MRKLFQILSFWLLVLFPDLNAQKAKDSYSQASVLSSGEWFRIAVTTDGIYRIDYSKIKQLGLAFPSNPKIFSNNSGQLSYYNNDPRPDDLKEISVYTFTGSDGVFNEGDYLLFFGKATHRWRFNKVTGSYDFIRHNYSDTAFYFMTSGTGPGKRVVAAIEPSQAVNYTSSEADALFVHELEYENLIKSGREWFQPISSARGIAINPGFTDLNTSEKIKYSIRVAARSAVTTQFRLYEGESVRKIIQVPGVNLFDNTGTYAQTIDSTGTIQSQSASPVFEIRFYDMGEPATLGWIDYVKLQARKLNSYTGSLTQFSDSRSFGPGRITLFKITSQVNDLSIWDISDPFNAKQILFTKTGIDINFKTGNDSLKTFVAFTPANILIPAIKPVAIKSQDLHGSGPADMVIITHPLFSEYAQKIADIHLNISGLVSQIVTPEQVYNEFSGGVPDIVAIRNFLRMKYMRQLGTTHPLKYLLLFGDGSFENKTLPPDNPNFIPTYQSQNSNTFVASFTSDDFYGLLDDDEGEADGNEDIGIGRFPVSDTIQAGILISKIRKYLDPVNMGDWKNIICLTADDEDANIHMSDAEGLAAVLTDSVPEYNIEKIYLDAFRQVTSATGESYPDANKAINDRINSGCLIFNYVGHGSEIGLSKEGVIKTGDINSWRNDGKLPLFITATCEFSRFDNIVLNVATREMTGKPSAGEMALLNNDGGAIALMSTTRIVYSAPNYFLNKNIFTYAFTRDEAGNTLSLGDIIRIAKNKSGNGPNKRNFSLLGDPALKLAYPWHGRIVTDSVNSIPVYDKIDSLKALSLITISGHVETNGGELMNTFNGVVSPLVYDKENKIKTLANDGGQTMQFNLRNSILFSGKTVAKDGRFSFTFLVPRDINYSFGTGKISYYASDNKEDMNGSFNKIIVGGFDNIAIMDTSGPEIRLYMNDTLFRNGGITDMNPILLAVIEDAGGVNTSGSGIGHDLTGYLDNDPNRSFVLNSYYVNDFDNYMRGSIEYNLSGLSEGSHSLTIKAWDNFNNSSEKSILFLVESGEKFVLKNVLNYPNPFLDETTITAEHNRPGSELDVVINIFSLNGRLIKVIKTTAPSSGYVLPPVIWDGKDNGGNRLGRGIYPYTVTVSTATGEIAKASGRMIIL